LPELPQRLQQDGSRVLIESACGVGVSVSPRSFRKGGGGVNVFSSFTGQPAPCGRLADGNHYKDHDDDCVVTRKMEYACGCVSIDHEYHDGSVSRRVVHHDGRVMVDELLTAE